MLAVTQLIESSVINDSTLVLKCNPDETTGWTLYALVLFKVTNQFQVSACHN